MLANLGKKGSSKNEFATAEMGNVFADILSTDCTTANTIVWIEQAHAMPKQGLSSTFKTGSGSVKRN